MSPKSFALFAAVLLLVAGLAPVAAADGHLSVAANQPAAGEETTVTVTHDGTPAENASVDVNATDGDYDGEGSYTTDGNGTVTLQPPEENVTVEIAAEWENHTASTTAELLAAAENSSSGNESFGQQVSAYVRSLLNGTEDQRRIGRMIANWVVANNPGNAPEHAGPPENTGPPEHAGPPDDVTGNETDGNATTNAGPGNSGQGSGNGNGPPDDPGKGNGNGKAKGQGK